MRQAPLIAMVAAGLFIFLLKCLGDIKASDNQRRIAIATERIADALEGR